MSNFVLDTSAALAWCFADEATSATRHLLQRLEKDEAIVPSLWYLEIANTLSLALRKSRITNEQLTTYLLLINNLSIVMDEETHIRALADTLLLSRHCELTTYDAAYLELAQRLDLPLASKDRQLCEAAKKLKIAFIKAD